jgi:hypothetical protein
LAEYSGDIGAPQQCRGRVGVGRRDRDAEAGLDVDRHVAEVERLVQLAEEPLGDLDRALLGRAGQQDGELVAGEPRHDVARPGPHHRAGPRRDLLEQLIAVLVAERVVDLLEPVKVEDEDGRQTAARQRLGDPFREELPVGQAGQGVVLGLVLVLGRLPEQSALVADGGDGERGQECQPDAEAERRRREHQPLRAVQALDGVGRLP